MSPKEKWLEIERLARELENEAAESLRGAASLVAGTAKYTAHHVAEAAKYGALNS